ncbi:hypothetical protein ACTG9Q_15280 [Actinokineospora sp. 24-640]
MATALITNGEGPLAHALVGRLADRGIQVTVLTRDPFAARRVLPRHALVATAGATRIGAVMTDFDLVIDNRVIPAAPPRRTGAVGLDHVCETRVMLTAAAKAGVSRLVHVRSMQDRRSYGWAHRRVGEILARSFPPRLSVARVDIAPLLGPEPSVTTEVNAIILRLLLDRLPLVGGGATSLLSADDAAAGIIAVAVDQRCPSRTMAGSRRTYREIAAVTAELLGCRPPPPAPRHLARAATALADLTAPSRELPLPLPSFSGHVHYRRDSVSWPAALLREDIQAVLDHFRRSA